jgi:hypothetical protein
MITQQGFPNVSSQLVDGSGQIQQAWLQLLIQLWNRTGGASGVITSDADIQNAILSARPLPVFDGIPLDLPPIVQTPLIASDDVSLGSLVLQKPQGSAAVENIGVTGHYVPLLDGINTWNALNTYSADVAATVTPYMSWKPTDYGVGKTQLEIIKQSATDWQIAISDGSSATGTINFSSTGLQWSGNTILTVADTGTSGHKLPYLDGANTWSTTQTFTVAPVFTAQAATRTALGLGTAATQNTGTSGANVPLLNGANTWSSTQTLTVAPVFTDQSGSRTALGLGTTATTNTGTTSGTVPLITTGSWTPTLVYATPGSGTVAYTTQAGNWFRIGNLIFIDFFLIFTPTKGTASGVLTMPTLPFGVTDAGRIGGTLASMSGGWTGLTNTILLSTGSPNTTLAIFTTNGTATTQATVANLTNAASHLISGSMIYNI